MLNPALSIEELNKQYRVDDRVRIENVLDPEFAAQVLECCRTKAPFDMVHFRDGEVRAWGGQKLGDLSPEESQKLQHDIWTEARKGVGFQYGGHKMRDKSEMRQNPDLAILFELYDFLRSDEMIRFISDVTGRDDLVTADAQYTRYTPGNFLTRHRDVVDGRGRRVGYVFNFSREWHPDWGGLLQFYEEDGRPRDAWSPQFNCLNLFDTRHIHAVTFVTPFAGEARFSMTGWFRSLPLD